LRLVLLLLFLAVPALAQWPTVTTVTTREFSEEARRQWDLLAAWQKEAEGQPEDLAGGRRAFAGLETPDDERVKGSWLTLPSGLRLRLLKPATSQGYLLAIHGGGWILGTALSDDKRNRELAAALNLTVVSPDYRLAPEHPFPAAAQDCEEAARWVLAQGPACITGSSAGAHLAALTMTRVPGFRAAVLWYGIYDLSRTPSWQLATDADHPDLEPSFLSKCVARFVPRPFAPGPDLRGPEMSPLYAPLKNLPPALFIVGGRDILVDDSKFMACRWATVASAELLLYPDAFHGFDGYDLQMAADARRRATDWLLSKR
jgi:acetyl esterase/lipase